MSVGIYDYVRAKAQSYPIRLPGLARLPVELKTESWSWGEVAFSVVFLLCKFTGYFLSICGSFLLLHILLRYPQLCTAGGRKVKRYLVRILCRRTRLHAARCRTAGSGGGDIMNAY